MDDVGDRRGESGEFGGCLDIHGCMEEKMGESVWVMTNWDGEVLCRCSEEGIARLIARALNCRKYTEE